ncbi:MAG: DNA (cytosine-5-)-methyltransferase [Rhodoferax sp.]|uniref:DNA cytosine methyltransferase n=1 Tax=Rhodoferax sp. TaxID=50421 RepID=UPI00273409E0|nr:DNA (cytosine-5-)-methyltransferase [Rhodoferax sp.]MDP3866530.1 DNA (cytosine-5-)-methyltransferase [Rhodoferax sp.]
MTIKIIDLFSGPGGLGEGFSAVDNGRAFSIAVSAEMDTSAHKTLTLRAFFRLTKSKGDERANAVYYDFCNSASAKHPADLCPQLWKLAEAEARQLTLGETASNECLDEIIRNQNLIESRTVLIGGPPCQAYSLVGRARNAGKIGYAPESDQRHYLYREYLRILAATRPSVFVMENVKGILSSKVGGRTIFHDILNDLRSPVKAVSNGYGPRYVIHSIANGTKFEFGMDASDVDARDFIVHAEHYGIPQARHRVILVGIREDVLCKQSPRLIPTDQVTVRDAFAGMPKLRSRLSKGDTSLAWRDKVISLGRELAKNASKNEQHQLANRLRDVSRAISLDLDVGSLRFERLVSSSNQDESSPYDYWIQDSSTNVWLNHETRSHMDSDLGRYLYASVFAEVFQRTPKGHREFALEGLAPAHANWESGKFIDRFRVQRFDIPSTTITSHISKDGHYFIHPDPYQCRSLTVREAARLQTFPDNYFFQGNRTEQYHQVGNAVPPMLANRIAILVKSIIDGNQR